MRDPEGLGGKDYHLPKEGDEDKESNNPRTHGYLSTWVEST